MSQRFSSPGHRRTIVAGADIASGATVVLRSGAAGIVGIAEDAIANGDRGEVVVGGVHRVPKVAATVCNQHALAYWDDTAKNYTPTSTSNTLAGEFHVAALSADTEAYVLLNGRPGAGLSD